MFAEENRDSARHVRCTYVLSLPCAFSTCSCVLERRLRPRAAPSALEASDPSYLPIHSPPQVVRVLHTPPLPVLAFRRRFSSDSNYHLMLPFFLTRDLARGIIDLPRNHLTTISDSASTIFTTTSKGSASTSSSSIVHIFVNILFLSFYKTEHG